MALIVTRADLHPSSPTMATKSLNPQLTTNALPPLPTSTTTPVLQKTTKAVGTVAPRIDVEPLYTQLKSVIGDNWLLYKQTVAEYVLGKRNQAELAWIIDPFLRGDPHKEHLHNQLIVAIFANAQREPPDQSGVASWVAANDKPTTASKPVSGDAAEQRLKTEIMLLPARERHRIKQAAENTSEAFTQATLDYNNALQIKLPDQATSSATGSKTNWDPEVRKRYAQPLFTESNEFPDTDSIQARMLPICYEEGVVNGFTPSAPAFMNTAAETYIKEQLTEIFACVRSNGPGWIKTANYKRRIHREEESWLQGEVHRSMTGLLPIELEMETTRQTLSLVDLRMNLALGGSALSDVPTVARRVGESIGIDDDDEDFRDDDLPLEEDEDEEEDEDATVEVMAAGTMLAPPKPISKLKPKPTTLAAATTNGVMVNGIHADGTAGEDYGWIGGMVADRTGLADILDECLAGV